MPYCWSGQSNGRGVVSKDVKSNCRCPATLEYCVGHLGIKACLSDAVIHDTVEVFSDVVKGVVICLTAKGYLGIRSKGYLDSARDKRCLQPTK